MITETGRDYERLSNEELIAKLMNVNEAGPGLQSTANFEGFIADDGPFEFTYGLIGSPPPVADPVMRELVRRGPAALPSLLRHLTDRRETQLIVGTRFSDVMNGQVPFGFLSQIFSEEYEPRFWSPDEKPCFFDDERCHVSSFDGPYTLKVGDICFALIGQIVDRNLYPVRYQPTFNLVVNSPVQSPALAMKTRRDWQGVNAAELRGSLLQDLHEARWQAALPRMRLYFPDAYSHLSGLDLKKRNAFEFDERRRDQQSIDENPAEVPLDRGIDTCRSLSDCLAQLDANINAPGEVIAHEEQIAAKLFAFGDYAEKALLERLTDPNRNWRVSATAIFENWPDLSEKHLPALSETIQMDGTAFAFEAIARINTPAAIQIMVADIQRYGDRSEASRPLLDLGPRGLPSLLSILAEPELWRTASEVITEMRGSAAIEAAHWGRIAADQQALKQERIAALRGLAAMKEFAKNGQQLITPLMKSRDKDIRNAAAEALRAMGMQ